MFNEIANEIANDLALEGQEGLSWTDFWLQLETLANKSTEQENGLLDIEAITFEKANTIIKSVKTNNQLQNRLLYGVLKPEDHKLSDTHKGMLRHIAKKKYEGITQIQLGEELSMDARSTFYYLKRLIELCLIIRQSVYISKKKTNLLYFHRFVPENKIKETMGVDSKSAFRLELLDKKILDLLENAPDNMMALNTIVSKLGCDEAQDIRWVQTRILRFHEKGVLEKVKANDGTNLTPCVRLPSSTQVSNKANAPNKREYPLQFAGTSRDLPIEYQIYQFIVEANENGVDKQDFLKRFPNLKWTFINFYLDKVCDTPDPETEQYMLYRTEEIANKARQYRYFSSDAYHKLELNTRQDLSDKPMDLSENNKRPREQVQDLTHERDDNTETEPPTKQIRTTVMEQQDEKNVPGEKRKRSPETGLSALPCSEPTPKKTNKKNAVNTTKLRRQQTILDILEKNRICEINQDLFTEFNKIEEAAGAQKIARKTFRNLANDLNSEGRLKIVTSDISMKFGLVEYKTFLLHHSLDENSKEFTDIIEKYKVGWTTPIPLNMKEFRKISVDKSPSKEPENQKATYQANLKHSIWRPIAIENGWISSKWLRVREIHNYIFTRFLQMHGHTSNKKILDSSDFVTLMPLDLLIKIFASLSLDTEMQEFIKTAAHRELCLKDLPEYIQAKLSGVNKRLKNLISSMLDVLEALELIRQLRENSKLVFEVKQEGRIYNYATSPPSLLETMVLQSTEDVNMFWHKLKNYYVKVHPFLVDNPASLSTYVKPHPLYNITLMRSWFSEERYSDEQKATLNSFVDYETGSTPSSSNKPLMAHLSKQLRLSMERIRTYYMSLDDAFRKERNKIKLREGKNKKTNQASDVIQTLMAASVKNEKVEIEEKKQTSFLEPTFIGSRRFRKLKVKSKHGNKAYLDDINWQTPFSQVEKDALALCYVIMRVRAKDSVFYWSPIKKVFENRNPEKCRRVWFHMMRSIPNLPVKVQQYQEQWERVFEKGIQNGDIVDKNPWDTVNYDLKGFLEYFILSIQHDTERIENRQSVILPANYQVLRNEFYISKYNTELQKWRIKEEQSASTFHFCQSRYDVPSKICRNDSQSIIIEAIAITIKMLMMLPPDIYKPDEAYKLMKRYPEYSIIKATNFLQEEGVVVRATAKKGRIPGRMLQISDRFLVLASGVAPFGFFHEARNYFSKLINEKAVELTNLNGNETACLLDLASQNKLNLDIKNRQRYIRLRTGAIYPKLSAGALCGSFVTSGLNIIANPKEITIHNQDSIMEPIIEPVHDIAKQLQDLEAQEPEIAKIYHIIKSFGVFGASIDEIDMESQKKSLRNVVGCCELLTSSTLPLIKLVGSTQLRYVAYDFISEYLIRTSDDVNLMEPWMWCDTSGNILLPVLKGCSRAVLSHILERPGISLVQLKESLECFFTLYELHHVLEYLESRGAIRCIKIGVQKKNRSLFGSRSVLSVRKTKVKCGNEISHYWLAPGYYTKI
ncbi:hypothetical protein K501DRAFT_334227 [Backusella circina FSU 941]|nr:hypothetical protein K501DRAFT_334227 [Backusella circina FSU 941]